MKNTVRRMNCEFKKPVLFSFAARRCGLVLLLAFLHHQVDAQRIENTSVLRSLQSDHYFRFYYENDLVGGMDYYYTSGMNIELVKPSFKKNPLNKVFFRLAGSKMKYGIALDHYAFTPLHIVYDNILYGDRPYAGCISINSFRIATNEKRRQQISTSFILGLIGPASLWKPVQTRLHKNLIPAPQPEGWDNQIKTDLILSYKINFEKNFINTKHFLLNGNSEIIAGTMNDKISGGLSVMIGKINDPFQSSGTTSGKQWEAYLFAHSLGSVVGYDATLQGGVFNRKSPYTLSAEEINRFTLQSQVGIMFNHKKFYLELAESFLSKEFKTGLRHGWSSIGIGLQLKQ